MLDFQQIYIFYFHAENRISKDNTSNVKPIFLERADQAPAQEKYRWFWFLLEVPRVKNEEKDQ